MTRNLAFGAVMGRMQRSVSDGQYVVAIGGGGRARRTYRASCVGTRGACNLGA